MKKWIIAGGAIAVAAFVAIASLAPVIPASAHGGGDARGPGFGRGFFPFDKIPGVLDAQTDQGILAAAGALNLHICADDGLLLVRKGDGTVTGGTSTSDVEWLGLHVYFGFNGCADATGKKSAALVVGSGLSLHAEGIGVAFLKGEGSYTNDGQTYDGSPDGVVVQIGSSLFGHKKTPTATNTPGAEPTATATPVAP